MLKLYYTVFLLLLAGITNEHRTQAVTRKLLDRPQLRGRSLNILHEIWVILYRRECTDAVISGVGLSISLTTRKATR
jgi:hypothetical protein